VIVEGVPVGVKDGGCVAAKEGYLVRKLSPLAEGNDCECAAAARLPID